MSDKISRKELKAPDGFVKTSGMAVKFLKDHKKEILISIAGLIVIYIGATLYLDYKKAKENKASIKLSELNLLIDENKLSGEAESKFNDFFKSYSGTLACQTGKLKIANLYLKEKNYDKAFELFNEVYKSTNSRLLKRISVMNLAYTKEEQKDFNSAVEFFRKLSNETEEAFEIQGYFGLARNQEKLREFDGARATYNRIISKYPNTEHAKLAEKYISMLEAK